MPECDLTIYRYLMFQIGASVEDDLAVPDWRKDNPIPTLGDETMNWNEREDKLQNALEWLRREIVS